MRLPPACAWLLSCLGCHVTPPPSQPMPAIWRSRVPDQPSDTLIVFLPGRRDRAAEFESRGFLAALAAAGVRADAVLVEAHLGYYLSRTLEQRLREDVLEPALQRGWRHFWVVGISLGGLGALMYEVDHPGTWDGIVLLAPYLGDDDGPAAAIDAAGGLDRWSPPADSPPDAFQERLWSWIKDYDASRGPPVLLGFGEADWMAAHHRRLAARLPPDRVFRRAGNHTWKTWRRLWGEMAPHLPRIDPHLKTAIRDSATPSGSSGPATDPSPP